MTSPETPEQAARRIFGRRAADYTTSHTHADPRVLSEVVRLALPALQRGDGPRGVLDIATGTGHTALALAPHAAAVAGLDLTPAMLAEARRLQAGRGIANVEYGIGDAHRLPFAAAAFAVVTCRRAAHHFSAIGAALAEMRRVLAPGGRLVIDDRSVPEDDRLDSLLNELDRLHDESHVREYRPDEWRRMLRAAGLNVAELAVYTQNRPLTAFTRGVAPANVERIHALIAGLTPAQRDALHLADVDGQPHLDHWYITIAADRL